MTSASGRWSIVYNGETYNYVELRAELEGLGHTFRSASDTEVVLEAVAEWGPGAFSRLNGMFACALFDREERRILLARDPFGIKPLYYAWDGDALVFASEIAAMFEFRGLTRAVDPAAYHRFLTTVSTDSGSGTLFRDIRRVPAAHYLEVRLDDPRSARTERYWTLDLERHAALGPEAAATAVRDAFLEGVRLQLRSDVPLGFALSGGMDSSSIVMAARTVLGRSAELHTFSFIPDDPRLTEEPHIDVVVEAAGTISHKLRLRPEELERDIETLAAVQGEPFASPVIYAQYRVLEQAREAGITVVLSGTGADEILAGYDRYLMARVASLLRQGRLSDAMRLLHRPVTPIPGGAWAALRGALRFALPGPVVRVARRLRRPAGVEIPWLDAAWFEERGVHPEAPWEARGRHVLREMLAYNLEVTQVEATLRYEDRSAMSFSLENRVPFLDRPLVELLFSLPEEQLLAPDGTRKAVLRAAMRGIVPDSVLNRTDKQGFAVPTNAWFDALRPWIQRHLGEAGRFPGLRGGVLERQTNPWIVWRCVSVASWAKRFEATFE